MNKPSTTNQGKERQRIFSQWSNPNIVEANLLIIRPQNGGVGCSELVRELALARHKKGDGTRDFKRSYLALKYPPNTANEQDFRRFFDSPRVIAECYNFFSGLFCIDISEHLQHINSQAFHMLMNYVAANKSRIRFVFIASTNDHMLSDTAFNMLKKYMRIDQLTLQYEKPSAYAAFAKELLGKSNIEVAKSVESALVARIDMLTANADFAGHKTIFRLVEDIIAEMRYTRTSILTAKTLEKIADLHLVDDISAHRKVGF